MKIENVEIPWILKFCPVEILLFQIIAGVKNLNRQDLTKLLLIELLLPAHVILTANFSWFKGTYNTCNMSSIYE